MERIALDCIKCGGSLEILPNSKYLTCQYCGMKHLVKWEGDVVTLLRIEEKVEVMSSDIAKMKLKEVLSKNTKLQNVINNETGLFNANKVKSKYAAKMEEYDNEIENLKKKIDWGEEEDPDSLGTDKLGLSEDFREELRYLVSQGHQIDAMKKLQKEKKLGLMDAKKYIESLKN